MKISTLLRDMLVAPPLSFAELLKKLLVPVKFSTTLTTVRIAPPTRPAELLSKSLVPMNVKEVLFLA